MAKSTRSKVKRAYRAKKREDGVYAAHEAARLQRLSSKLNAVRGVVKEGGDGLVGVLGADGSEEQRLLEGGTSQSLPIDNNGDMDLDNTSPDPATVKTKISTHGRTPSRRDEWRMSKSMEVRPKSRGMNRQGGLAGRRKAGRSHRRR